jgi:hypothetical protein
MALYTFQSETDYNHTFLKDQNIRQYFETCLIHLKCISLTYYWQDFLWKLHIFNLCISLLVLQATAPQTLLTVFQVSESCLEQPVQPFGWKISPQQRLYLHGKTMTGAACMHARMHTHRQSGILIHGPSISAAEDNTSDHMVALFDYLAC